MSERPDLAAVTAAILAGGRGTRLRSVVADRPKVLAEVNGRPFGTYLLNWLAEAGIRQVVFCTGHRAGAVRESLGRRFGPLDLRYSVEPQPMGTGGALRHALHLLDSDPVLALNGDSFIDLNPAAFLSWYCEHGRPAAALALTYVADAGRYGRVELGSDERIGAFEEKSGGGRPGWINAGIYLLRRGLLAGIPAQGIRSLEREVLPQKLAGGVFGYRCRGRFIDIGTPQSYRRAGEFFGLPDTGKGGPHT